MEANEYPGPAVVDRVRRVHAGARHRRRRRDPPGEARGRVAGVPAVHLRPAPRPTIAERLSLQGNPALRADWATGPTARRRLPGVRPSEGRFAPHFGATGADPEIAATADDRLANWRTLQELAGQAAGT
jgi:hypothetical protein